MESENGGKPADWEGRVSVLTKDAYNRHAGSFFSAHGGSSWHEWDAKFIVWMGAHWMLVTAVGIMVSGTLGICLWQVYRRILLCGKRKRHYEHAMQTSWEEEITDVEEVETGRTSTSSFCIMSGNEAPVKAQNVREYEDKAAAITMLHIRKTHDLVRRRCRGPPRAGGMRWSNCWWSWTMSRRIPRIITVERRYLRRPARDKAGVVDDKSKPRGHRGTVAHQ